MAKINVILMAFVLIAWTVFKLLFLTGGDVESTECGATATSLGNCIVSVKTDCNGLIDDGDICLNLTAFADTLNIDNSDCGGIFDVGACIEYLANVIFAVVQLVVSLVLVILALVLDIVLLVAMYLTIGMTPLPAPCPAVINLLLIGPFVIANLVVIVSFIPGE